jgi:hypothetical protein
VPKANKNKRKRAEIDLSDREEECLDKRVTRGQIKKIKINFLFVNSFK